MGANRRLLPLLLLLVSARANAQDTDAASRLAMDGRRAYDASDYGEAARLLLAALDARDTPSTRVYLAASLAWQGKCGRVRDLLAPLTALPLPSELASLAGIASRTCSDGFAEVDSALPARRQFGLGAVTVRAELEGGFMYQTYHSVEGGAMPGFSGGVLGIGLSGEYLVLDWLSVGAVLSKQWDWHDTRGDGTPKAVDAFSVGPRVTAYFHLSDLSHLFGAIDGGYFRRTGGKDLARNGYYVRGAMGIALRPAAHFLLAIGVAYRLSSTADDLDGDRWWMKTEWTTGHSLLLTIAPAILF